MPINSCAGRCFQGCHKGSRDLMPPRTGWAWGRAPGRARLLQALNSGSPGTCTSSLSPVDERMRPGHSLCGHPTAPSLDPPRMPYPGLLPSRIFQKTFCSPSRIVPPPGDMATSCTIGCFLHVLVPWLPQTQPSTLASNVAVSVTSTQRLLSPLAGS